MIKRFVYAALFGALVLCWGAPAGAVHAQEAGCPVDLSDIAAILVRAQAEAASGGVERALTLLQQADELLAEAETICASAAQHGGIALTEDYLAASFALNYPLGWTLGDNYNTTSGGGVIMANRRPVLDGFRSGVPILETGDRYVQVSIGTASEVSGNPFASEDLAENVQFIRNRLAEQFEITAEAEYYTLAGTDSARFSIANQQFEGVTLVLQIRPDRFALVLGVGVLREDNAGLIALVEGIGRSIRLF